MLMFNSNYGALKVKEEKTTGHLGQELSKFRRQNEGKR
jgi:hypothetical protein